MNFWNNGIVLLRRDLSLNLRALWKSCLGLPASGAFDRAAAIAYYAVLAVFPFVLIVVLVGGRFLQDPDLADQAIEFLSDRIPVAGDFLDTHLDTIQKAASGLGTLSAIGLLWSAMGLFTAIRNGMDAMSGTRRHSFLKGHWVSFASVLLAAIGLMLLIFLSTLLGMFGSLEAVQWLDDVVPFLPVVQMVSRYSGAFVSLVAFLCVLRLLPTRKPAFRDCLLPAVGLTLAEHLFRALFVHFLLTRQDLNAVHGPLSAAIGFMGWAYASSLLLLWASLWVHQVGRQREGTVPA
jgi:membrane protein